VNRAAEVSEGTLLAGRYRVTAHLGAGGMAQVWSGIDEVLDRPVAIKLMDAKLLAIPSFRSRFRDEARAAGRLSHPRIVAVHDYGEARPPGGAVLPYIVMDLLAGQTLAQRLRSGPMTWQEAARVCREVGEAPS
jgi:serine/threonine-protein kinase